MFACILQGFSAVKPANGYENSNVNVFFDLKTSLPF